jgi:hypothetical protein
MQLKNSFFPAIEDAEITDLTVGDILRIALLIVSIVVKNHKRLMHPKLV